VAAPKLVIITGHYHLLIELSPQASGGSTLACNQSRWKGTASTHLDPAPE